MVNHLKQINNIKSKTNTKENLNVPQGIIQIDAYKLIKHIEQLKRINVVIAKFAIYIVKSTIYIPNDGSTKE